MQEMADLQPDEQLGSRRHRGYWQACRISYDDSELIQAQKMFELPNMTRDQFSLERKNTPRDDGKAEKYLFDDDFASTVEISNC